MSYENMDTIPVYHKALKLCEISKHIASYVSFNKDLVKLYQSNSLRDIIADSLLIDTTQIRKQILQAEHSTSYTERIENASNINIMIRNINSYCTGLEKDGVKEIEYVDLLRNEISSFRSTYKKWKNSFSKNDLDF